MQRRGRGAKDRELMVLLPKRIIFRNILFLPKLFCVSVFVALEGENSDVFGCRQRGDLKYE